MKIFPAGLNPEAGGFEQLLPLCKLSDLFVDSSLLRSRVETPAPR